MRSGTSVGAMICEAEHSESAADFVRKIAISQKEINETLYWLELLCKTDYITVTEYESIKEDAIEVAKIISSSIKTAKNNIKAKANSLNKQ